ncbi:unnamed protein product [Candidula unifasciata]|uniref:Uncharacterized protein n=1 Tax=Candidula unifasciata TaxID=100452 RepID=A0A8S3ZL92_9EUPU|nr:unnamed protein product [Candidula unifasciata]
MVYTNPGVSIAAKFVTPGPAYALPGLVGEKGHDPRSVHYKYPSYSFGVRHGRYKNTYGPGPSYYPDPKVYRDGYDGVPQYSLYSRPKDIRVFATPGPGAYCIEPAASVVRRSSPAYSFGSRHSHRRTDKIPAANSYALPGMIGPTVQSGKPQAPCYSFRSRPNVAKYIRTPGPGTYSTTDPSIYKHRAPLYSLTSRHVMSTGSSQKPGPGAHMPQTASIQRCSPAYSFGIRHSDHMTPLIVDVPDLECCCP